MRSVEVEAALDRLRAGGREDRDLAVVLDALRSEAIADVRRLGCSCRPRLSLTAVGVGPLELPAWMSEHEDSCRLVVEHRARIQARTS